MAALAFSSASVEAFSSASKVDMRALAVAKATITKEKISTVMRNMSTSKLKEIKQKEKRYNEKTLVASAVS
jgi:hypothetical protein